MTSGPINSLGLFLPTNVTFSEDQQQFLIQITNVYSQIARFINLREVSLYNLQEAQTGQQWFSSNVQQNKGGYRTVINFGALPNNSTKSVPHGISITPSTVFTHIYGTGSSSNTAFIPIPYVNVATPTDGVAIIVGTTNVSITTTTANWVNYNAVVVLEYLKN